MSINQLLLLGSEKKSWTSFKAVRPNYYNPYQRPFHRVHFIFHTRLSDQT